MRKLLIILLFIFPMGAAASDCFPFDAWRAAIVAGDGDEAQAVLDRAGKACGCSEDDQHCLPLPGFSVAISVTELQDVGRRMLDWQKSLPERCKSTESNADRNRESMENCYKKQTVAFHDGIEGEAYGRLFAPMVLEMGPLDKEQIDFTPGPGGAPVPKRKQYSREAERIGKQICDLETRLEDNKGKLERVRRRGNISPGAKYRRERELQRLVKEMTDLIVRLKQDFRQKTGETFNPFDFCGPAAAE
ncbi:MAG: hypothetical protein P9L99_12635 [Candidatus Lernaella stagnicola]|nr:hypothetical protein [Candidatus Lernaella stagnicola]